MSATIFKCQCSCGQSGPANRMQLVRSLWTSGNTTRPSRVSWQVLKTCAPHFEAELVCIHAVEDIARQSVEHGWWWKLGRAAQIYDLQKQIYARRKGEAQAEKIARRCVLLLLAPRWLSLKLRLPEGADAQLTQ